MKLIKFAANKYKISKDSWEEMGKLAGWIKKAMAVWLPEDIKKSLHGDNWLIDMMADRVPPEVGITKLKGIDPDIALSLPKIYNYGPRDIREINGQNYIIIKVPTKSQLRKTKANYVRAINVDTGEVEELIYEEIMPQLEQEAKPITKETMEKVNKEVKKHNARIDEIDKATANLALLPLQLGRVDGLIDERIATLDAIIAACQAQLNAPKPESMTGWEEGIQGQLLNGDLDEITFVDTVLHTYKYKYDQLLEDLKTVDANGNPKAPNLKIPDNIEDPEALRTKLMNIGDLAFREYVDAIEKKKQSQEAPGVAFDIDEIDFGRLHELTEEDVPKQYSVTGYRDWNAYVKTVMQKINGSQRTKDLLLQIKNSLAALGQEIGGLKEGQRSKDYLKNTPEGQVIVDNLRNFINAELGSFITQYKREIINEEGKIDKKKMGSAGSVGSAALIVTFGRLYQVISTLLKKLASDEPIDMPEFIRQPAEEVPVEGLEEPIAGSKNKITRMSELLWKAFEERMRVR
jgi:hypothetical protein